MRFYWQLLLFWLFFFNNIFVHCQLVKENKVQKKTEEIMKIKSSSFNHGQSIPAIHSCKGKDLSPALQWTAIPSETQSLVLIMDDPDAPGKTWDHWIVFNIPPAITGFEENVDLKNISDVIKVGKNSWEKNNYGGPCPPSGTHRYFFKLYALDKLLDLSNQSTKKDIENAMQGHIISSTEMYGTFSK